MLLVRYQALYCTLLHDTGTIPRDVLLYSTVHQLRYTDTCHVRYTATDYCSVTVQ